MTQAPEAVTADPTVQPDSVVGFGLAELGLIVNLAEDDARGRAYDALRLDASYFTDDVTKHGLSSLVARRWAEIEGDAIRLSGPAYLLGYCVSAAARWTQLAFLDAEGSDIAIYLHAPECSALLQPRAAGSWFAMFRKPEGRDAEVLHLTLESAAALAPQSTAFFDSTTRSDEIRFFVRRVADNQWKYAVTPNEDPTPERVAAADVPITDVDTAGLLDALDRLLALPPDLPTDLPTA